MKRQQKELIAVLEAHGYAYVSTNSKGFLTYANGAAEVRISPAITEAVARREAEKVRRAHGTAPKPNKRNPAAIRERQERMRRELAADIERSRGRLAELLAAREGRLDGMAAVATEEEIRRISRHIEQRDAEMRELSRLMAAPRLENKARHTGGGS